MAASATFALKAGVWFRRARLLIVSPDSRVNLARRQAETPLIPLFRFLRSALATNLGFHARVFDNDDVVRLLAAAIESEGGQTAFAKHHGGEARPSSFRPPFADASVLRLVPPVEQVIDPNRHCLHVTMEDGDNVVGRRKGAVV